MQFNDVDTDLGWYVCSVRHSTEEVIVLTMMYDGQPTGRHTEHPNAPSQNHETDIAYNPFVLSLFSSVYRFYVSNFTHWAVKKVFFTISIFAKTYLCKK